MASHSRGYTTSSSFEFPSTSTELTRNNALRVSPSACCWRQLLPVGGLEFCISWTPNRLFPFASSLQERAGPKRFIDRRASHHCCREPCLHLSDLGIQNQSGGILGNGRATQTCFRICQHRRSYRLVRDGYTINYPPRMIGERRSLLLLVFQNSSWGAQLVKYKPSWASQSSTCNNNRFGFSPRP